MLGYTVYSKLILSNVEFVFQQFIYCLRMLYVVGGNPHWAARIILLTSASSFSFEVTDCLPGFNRYKFPVLFESVDASTPYIRDTSRNDKPPCNLSMHSVVFHQNNLNKICYFAGSHEARCKVTTFGHAIKYIYFNIPLIKDNLVLTGSSIQPSIQGD